MAQGPDGEYRGRGHGVRSDDLDEAIFKGLSQGQTLREICRREGISPSAVYNWERTDEEFAARIARAREDGERWLEDEILEIADDATNDYVKRMNSDGSTVMELDREHVQRSKLRIYAREKTLAWKNPRRYGTGRVDVTSGGDPLPPADVDGISTRIASILAEGERRIPKVGGDE